MGSGASSANISFPIFIIPSLGNKRSVEFGVVHLNLFDTEFKYKDKEETDNGWNNNFPPSKCVFIPSKQNKSSDQRNQKTNPN